MPSTNVSLPLAGITVVELSDNASAPFAGFILAGLGAQVWKVERPGKGDSARGWGPSQWKGSSGTYHALNRGKKSICLDIKNPEQLEQLRKLIVDHADVFLHNLRPGSCGKYGLDAETLRSQSGRLIHCDVGAFGNAGPLRDLPGYDPLMQAFSGIMSITGEEGQAPVRAGVSIVDFGTGMWAVIGIVCSLFRRERLGGGATVNTSLLETAISWMSAGIANYAADGHEGGRHGSGVAFIVPHRTYQTSDGYLAVSCANDQLFSRLCAALGSPQWAEDSEFATNAARLRNRETVDQMIEAKLVQHPRAYWQDALNQAGIACAPVQTTAEIYHHEQTKALHILAKPSEDEIALVGLPLSFDGTRPPPLHAVHETGQDNEELDMRLNPALNN